MNHVLSLVKDTQISSRIDLEDPWREVTGKSMSAGETSTVQTIGKQEGNTMSELNPQPLPPGKVSLEDAVEAIMRGVLRALDSRNETAPSAAVATDALTVTRSTAFPNIRVIAGGIIDPAVRNL